MASPFSAGGMDEDQGSLLGRARGFAAGLKHPGPALFHVLFKVRCSAPCNGRALAWTHAARPRVRRQFSLCG